MLSNKIKKLATFLVFFSALIPNQPTTDTTKCKNKNIFLWAHVMRKKNRFERVKLKLRSKKKNNQTRIQNGRNWLMIIFFLNTLYLRCLPYPASSSPYLERNTEKKIFLLVRFSIHFTLFLFVSVCDSFFHFKV